MTVHRALSRLLVLPIVCLGPMFLTGLATAAEGHLTRLPLKSAAIAVAFSPDGRYLAAGSHDGTVYLWEMPPKAEKAVCLRQHTCRVSAVCFAPAGRCLASGSWDGSIALWDPSSDKPRRVVRVGGRVTSLAVSPDGKILAIGLLPPMGDLGQRGEVQVRSLEDGRLLRRLEEEDLEREGNATHVSVAFVPGSPWLAAGYNLHWQLGDCVQTVGVVRLRDPATGSRSPTCPMTSLHRAGLYGLHALAVCPLGRLLALAEGQPDPEEPLPNSWEDPVVDSRVSLWDANRGTLHRNLPLWLDEKGRLQDLDALRCLAYSSDGFFLCAGARSGSLYLWEVHTGEPLIEFDPVEQLHDYSRGTEALSLAFSPDARFLAFCRGKLVVLSDLSPKDWGPSRPEEQGKRIKTYPLCCP
jgi:WD40 repeat protein